jgi:hypothetical protein
MTDYRDLKPVMSEIHRRDIAEIEQQKEAIARATRERRRLEQRAQRSELDELRAELDAVRDDVAARHEVIIGAAGEALGQVQDKILDHVDAAIRKVQNELFTLVERRFGELMGRFDAITTEARSRSARNFKFSNERDDDGPLELPNPLRPRRVLDS